MDPLSYCRTFIERAIDGAGKTIRRNTKAMGFSLYRYDTTGRIVHYGPEGEVLEYDSAFHITGVRNKQAEQSLSVSKTVEHLPQ